MKSYAKPRPLRLQLLTRLFKKWTGGRVYLENLIHALELNGVGAEDRRVVLYRERPWERVLGMSLFGKKSDVVFPFDPADVSFQGIRVGWLPDFQHVHLPGYFSQSEREGRERWMEQVVSHSDRIVLSSRDAFETFAEKFPSAVAKGVVLSFRVRVDFAWPKQNPETIARRYRVPRDYFFVANQFWQHKGHLALVRALALLAHQGHFPNVVCTGAKKDYRAAGFFPEFSDEVRKLGLSEQIFVLGEIPFEDKVQLMRGARAVVQPSECEGWSTVVEEARVLGKVLVVSDLPVHREQNPPGAQFFRVGDASDLARVLQQNLDLPPGPDPFRERPALEEGRRLSLEYGNAFLDLIEGLAERSVLRKSA